MRQATIATLATARAVTDLPEQDNVATPSTFARDKDAVQALLRQAQRVTIPRQVKALVVELGGEDVQVDVTSIQGHRTGL